MNKEFLMKLLVAYGIYKGIQYLFGGVNTNENSAALPNELNTLLRNLGFNGPNPLQEALNALSELKALPQ